MITEATDSNFSSLVLHANQPVCVYFWADWAGPCHLFDPVFEELAETNKDFSFVSFDIEKNPVTPANYGLRSVPYCVTFENGKPTHAFTGAVDGETLGRFLKCALE